MDLEFHDAPPPTKAESRFAPFLTIPRGVPAGTVLVLDIKTGKLRVKNGRPQWWHDYAIQTQSDPSPLIAESWFSYEWQPWRVAGRSLPC